MSRYEVIRNRARHRSQLQLRRAGTFLAHEYSATVPTRMYNVSQFPVVWQHTFVQRTAEAFVEKGSAGFLVACMENVCFLVVQDSWMRCSNGRVTVRNWMKSSRLYREDIGSQLFVLQCDASGAVYVQRAFDFLALFKNVAAPKRPISFGDRNRGIDCICHIQYR